MGVLNIAPRKGLVPRFCPMNVHASLSRVEFRLRMILKNDGGTLINCRGCRSCAMKEEGTRRDRPEFSNTRLNSI